MKSFSASILAGFLLLSCNAKNNETNIEMTQDMMDQISLKAQDWDPLRDGKGSMRVPPEHTVPRGHAIEKYVGDMAASAKLENPLHGNFNPDVIEKGKAKFDIYCAICHGGGGRGDGNVAPKMLVKPRDLMSEAALKYTDGHIYSVIREGFGTMGSYANQIYNPADRWAVVNYVRSMQKKGAE